MNGVHLDPLHNPNTTHLLELIEKKNLINRNTINSRESNHRGSPALNK
jgi:hypothetical protein